MSALQFCVKKTSPRPTCVFDAYWTFAAERQNIYFRRIQGASYPWTDDEVLLKFRFTNAYRVLDRVSQYLITNIQSGFEEDISNCFFRSILFKMFNRISTWQSLEREIEEITLRTFDVDKYCRVLDEMMLLNERVFSGAYIMPSGSRGYKNTRKHRTYLELLDYMIKNRLCYKISENPALSKSFEAILEYPLMGQFLAFQYSIDLAYSEPFASCESDFVVAGPGALSGIRKCFEDCGEYSMPELIMWVFENQEIEFKSRGIEFESLFGRRLQPIDCQNLFCEIDKYSRVTIPQAKGLGDRTRIKQGFKPSGDVYSPTLPKHWNISCAGECFQSSLF